MSKTGKNKTGDDRVKKYKIIVIIVLGIILGFLTGIFIYKINQTGNDNKEIVAEKIEDECTAIGQLDEMEIASLLETSNKIEKTSPNCTITLKVYHEACNHLIETKKKIEDVEVNMTEEELKKRFCDWEVQKFTPTEIVLYKEVKEFCDQHFLLKDEDGYIKIYKLDENNNAKLLNTTEISTEYLSAEDLEKIKNGITVYTEKELNKTLEDFE